MIVAEDVVIKSGTVPSFYRDAACRQPAQLTQHRNHYSYSYVRGRRANAEDVPKILEVAARDIWKVPKMCTVLLEQRAKDHFCNNVSAIARNHCPVTYRAVYEALDVIKNAALPLAETVHGQMLFENIVFQLDGEPVFVNPIDPCQVYTPALDRGALLQSYVMRWERQSPIEGCVPWEHPRGWPEWANVTDWAFLVAAWVRLIPDFPMVVPGLQILGSIKPA